MNDPVNPDTFANRITETRNRLKMNQREFAAYVGAPVPTVRNWERGVRLPPSYCVRLLDVLQTLEYLHPAIHASLLPPDSDSN